MGLPSPCLTGFVASLVFGAISLCSVANFVLSPRSIEGKYRFLHFISSFITIFGAYWFFMETKTVELWSGLLAVNLGVYGLSNLLLYLSCNCETRRPVPCARFGLNGFSVLGLGLCALCGASLLHSTQGIRRGIGLFVGVGGGLVVLGWEVLLEKGSRLLVRKEDEVGWTDWLFLSYLNPIFSLGEHTQLSPSTLPPLFHSEAPLQHANALEQIVHERTKDDGDSKSDSFVVWVVLWGWKWVVVGMVLLQILSVGLSLLAPLLLRALLDTISSPSTPQPHKLLLYAFLLVLTQIITALVSAHAGLLNSRLQARIRGALIPAVIRKAAAGVCVQEENTEEREEEEEKKQKVVGGGGQVANLVSVDVGAAQSLPNNIILLTSLPIQTGLTLFLLHQQVSWGFAAGLGVLLVVLPLNTLVTSRIGGITDKLLAHRDDRVRDVSAAVRGIRAVKYLAAESAIFNSITHFRNLELTQLYLRKMLDAVCVFLWATTPVLMALATFSVAAALNPTSSSSSSSSFSPAAAFAALALLRMLIFPMNAFPWVLAGTLEGLVSLRRLSKFLDAPPPSPPLPSSSPHLLTISGSFSFSKRTPFAIRDISLSIQPGECIVVVGRVGSGKTAFLHALSNSLTPLTHQSTLCLHHPSSPHSPISIAISPEKGWLRASTIAKNITTLDVVEEKASGGIGGDDDDRGNDDGNVDRRRLETVVDVCGLRDEVESEGFPHGLGTRVGPGGRQLSGGQQARVSLARCLYSHSPLLLLDSPLASLDSYTAHHIWTNALSPSPASFLSKENRARVITTHSPALTHGPHRTIVLGEGRVIYDGPGFKMPPDVLTMAGIEEEREDRRSRGGSEVSGEGGSGDGNAGGGEGDSWGGKVETEEGKERGGRIEKGEDEGKEEEEEEEEEEKRQVGAVAFEVVSAYGRSAGWGLVGFTLLSAIAMQASRNVSDWWLAEWTSAVSSPQDQNPSYHGWGFRDFVGVYGGIAAANVVFASLRSYLFALAGYAAAKQLHEQLLEAVLWAPLQWVERTSVGRFLNRFNADTWVVDDSLPFQANILLAQFLSLFGTVVVLVYASGPALLVAALPLGAAYFRLQHRYRSAARELRRLDAVSQSPVFALAHDVAEGAWVLAAMGKHVAEQERREAVRRVHANLRASYTALAAVQWLGLRLQAVGLVALTFVITSLTLSSLSNPTPSQTSSTSSAGLAGLALSYAVPVVEALQGLMGAFAETEKELVAVERVAEYANMGEMKDLGKDEVEVDEEKDRGELEVALLKEEEDEEGGVWERRMSEEWPEKGEVDVAGLSVRYDGAEFDAVKDVTFHVAPKEIVAITGVTGSGKTTILLALANLVKAYKGMIRIDQVPIDAIPSNLLRTKAIAAIPQDPWIAPGRTVFENLTIALKEDSISTADANRALAEVELEHLGLDSVLCGEKGRGHGEEGGVSLTIGERQKFSLARALLSPAKIFLVDEGDAHVDQATATTMRRVLQEAIKSRNACAIVVAHRPELLQAADRVIRIEKGRIKGEGGRGCIGSILT